MNFLKLFCVRLVIYFWKIMATIKIPVGSKPNRPHAQKIIFVEVIEGEFVTSEKWIIVNDKGETLDAPMFFNKNDAEKWLDEYHPKNNYSPD